MGQTRGITEGRWLWTPRDEGTIVELNEEVCLSSSLIRSSSGKKGSIGFPLIYSGVLNTQ